MQNDKNYLMEMAISKASLHTLLVSKETEQIEYWERKRDRDRDFKEVAYEIVGLASPNL